MSGAAAEPAAKADVAEGSDGVTGLLMGVASTVGAVAAQITHFAKEHATAEGAKALLDAAVEKGKAALAGVRRLADELKDVPATELPLLPIYEAINAAKVALQGLLDAAMTFDKKYEVSQSLTSLLTSTRDKAAAAIIDGTDRLQAIVRGTGEGGGGGGEATDGAAGGGAGGPGSSSSVQAAAAALVSVSLQRASDALQEVLRQAREYDSVNTAATKAHEYLDGAVTKTKAALAEVQAAAQNIREKPLKELPLTAVTSALDHAKEALNQVAERARAYDNEIGASATITAHIETAQNRARNAVDNARSALADARVAATTTASSVTDSALRRLMALDEEYGVTAKTTPVVGAVVGAVGDAYARVDAALGVTEKATALDAATGGYGAAAFAKATELVDTTVTAVAGRMEAVRSTGEGKDTAGDAAAAKGEPAE